MNVKKEAILLAVKGLLISPIESIFITAASLIPIAGTVLWILAVIKVARFFEGLRREYYLEMNAALFTACAYSPGLIAAVIFCILMFTLPLAYNDINGWGGIARLFFGLAALISQISLSIAGWIYALKSRKYTDLN